MSSVLEADGWVNDEIRLQERSPVELAPVTITSLLSIHLFLPLPYNLYLYQNLRFFSLLLIFILLDSMCLPCFTWNWAKHEDPLDALESMPQHHTWVHDGQSWVLKPTVGLLFSY